MATVHQPGTGKLASVLEPIRPARGRPRPRHSETAPITGERMAWLLSASPVVTYSFEATDDFAPTFVSDNIRDIFGYEPHEYLDSPDFWRECVHPDDLAAVEAEAAHLFRNGRHTVEYRFRRKDGTYRWVHDEQRVIARADGAPGEIVGSWSDVTDRRLAQDAARAARERIDRLLATSPAVIYSFDATGEFAPTYISHNVKDLLGYDREEYLASSDFWATRVHPDDSPRILAAYERLMHTGRLSSEYRFRRKDGSYCWVSDELRVVRDAAGQPVEVVGAWSDLTSRSEAEIGMRRNERRLTGAIEAISQGLALFDAEDRLIVCNRAYGEMLRPGTDAPLPGTTYEALIRTAAQLGLVEDAEGRPEEWVAERLAQHRAPSGVHVQRHTDGRWVQIDERRMTEGGTIAVHTDITESKLAEEQLRAAQQQVEEANARLVATNRELELLSNKLSKYLSPEVHSSIFAGPREVRIAPVRKRLTVFRSEIVDFAALTDDLDSAELTALLNRYLAEMARIALQHGATIDRYIGDAVLAFVGDPETRGVRQDALACIEMAVAMQRRMRELQSEWRDAGVERSFQLRTGINTGNCTIGSFGSEDRWEYTAIGREVDRAAQLQSHAAPGAILLSHATHLLVSDRYDAEEQPPIEVDDRAEPMHNYKLASPENGAAIEAPICTEMEGLRLYLDLDKLDRTAAATALEAALWRLRG